MKWNSQANRTLLAYFPGDENVTLQEVTYMPSTASFLKDADDEVEVEENNLARLEHQKYILSQFGKKWKNQLFIAFISFVIFIVIGQVSSQQREMNKDDSALS